MKKSVVIIMGPTGVGKSDCAEVLASALNGVIINGDLGQMYAPLSIGTAKPQWQQSPIEHYLFDTITQPRNISVVEYRKTVLPLITTSFQRSKVPIIVGGSGFYIQSLLFPPHEHELEKKPVQHDLYQEDTELLWHKLYALDPERAHAINKTDRYRIVRALTIFDTTGILPSQARPGFVGDFDFHIIFLQRDRHDLYERINIRVEKMIHAGFINEVQALSPEWKEFLTIKKIIGYDLIIDYLEHSNFSEHNLIAAIQQKTRQYAKRQISFWNMFKKRLPAGTYEEVNLTFLDLPLYIKQLSQFFT